VLPFPCVLFIELSWLSVSQDMFLIRQSDAPPYFIYKHILNISMLYTLNVHSKMRTNTINYRMEGYMTTISARAVLWFMYMRRCGVTQVSRPAFLIMSDVLNQVFTREGFNCNDSKASRENHIIQLETPHPSPYTPSSHYPVHLSFQISSPILHHQTRTRTRNQNRTRWHAGR
jgi:hypothetical protein